MLKRFRLQVISLAICLLLLCSLSATAALDTPLHQSYLDIAETAQLSTGVYWNSAQSDRVTENYIEYIPNDIVKPVVAYGNYIYGGNRITAVNSVLSERGYTVVAGMNGDYFNTGTIVPLSTVIEDGVLKGNEGSSWASIGFRADGSAMIARLNLNMYLTIDGADYTIYRLNKELLDNNGIQLYTSDYATTTRSSMASYAAILQPTTTLGVNQTVTATVVSVIEADGPVDIPHGCFVAVIAQSCENEVAKQAIFNLYQGQQVQIRTTADAAWNDVQYAVGGGEKLLTNGQVVTTETARAPRSALGVRADGSFIMYTVDGRQSGYSVGASLNDVANRLKELGCVEAVNLDGGSSTTLQAVYPGDASISTINSPSDGSLRTCANYILLVHQQQPTYQLHHLHFYPFDVRILAGSSTSFELKATDHYYFPVAAPTSGISYSTSAPTLGTVDANGRFTAGSQAGELYVYASYGAATGAARVTVVTQPDSAQLIYADSGEVVGDSVSLTAGGSLQLSVQATHNRLPVVADASAAFWTLTGDIGTVTQSGLLTIHSDVERGSGVLTATIGNRSVTANVIVGTDADLIEDFEDFATLSGPGYTVTANDDKAYVRYGHYSGRVEYNVLLSADAESNRVSIPLYRVLNGTPSSFDFWLYGDGTLNQLMLRVLLSNGQASELDAGTLAVAGWQRVSVALPSGVTQISSLDLVAMEALSGVFYLDQMMACYGMYEDTTPPTVQIDLSGQSVRATILDDQDYSITSSNITVNFDGGSLAFNYDAATGLLTATIPEADGRPHRLSITVRDKSGNVGWGALDIAAGAEQAQPFADMSGHWAEDYVTYLYQQGIVNGMQENGRFVYQPNANMTRAQFAVIMTNWLGVDPTQYNSVQLPFADLGAIADWALPSVRAMYALGITQGSSLNGLLYFNPNNAISRAEAMTMIGRTQECGYAEAALTFADAASVPGWAAPYIRSLVARGVISGVGDNLLAPNQTVTRGQVARMLYGLM